MTIYFNKLNNNQSKVLKLLFNMTTKCIDDYNIWPYILMLIVIQLLIVIQI